MKFKSNKIMITNIEKNPKITRKIISSRSNLNMILILNVDINELTL